MDQSERRKRAYKYILQLLRRSPMASDADTGALISLNDLMLLKEGKGDPSPALVNGIRQILKGVVTESEIEANLVAPFETKEPSK